MNGNNFVGCGYTEICECIKYRIQWLREFKKMKNDNLSKRYPTIFPSIIMDALIQQSEIKTLLEIRHIMREGHYKQWNPNIKKINNLVLVNPEY